MLMCGEQFLGFSADLQHMLNTGSNMLRGFLMCGSIFSYVSCYSTDGRKTLGILYTYVCI